MVSNTILRKISNSCAGATIVEAALVMPLYFMLVLGVIGWGLVLWEVNSLQYAAEKSARCSVLPTDLQGNRLCVNWSDVDANVIGWIPSISPTSFTPSATAGVASPQPNISRSFQSSRTGTAESYNVNCIEISVPNNFLPNFDHIPNLLQQNFCRPSSS